MVGLTYAPGHANVWRAQLCIAMPLNMCGRALGHEAALMQVAVLQALFPVSGHLVTSRQ